MIDLCADLSVSRQCELLRLPRSTFYYQLASESPENLLLMRRIDLEHMQHPFYGSRRIAIAMGINRKHAAQFTSKEYVAVLKEAGIKISWDGNGRALDNVFVERLWRSVKYEEVYLHDYQSGLEAGSWLDEYFKFYSYNRPHQSLDYKTPASVYFSEPGTLGPFKSQTKKQAFALKS